MCFIPKYKFDFSKKIENFQKPLTNWLKSQIHRFFGTVGDKSSPMTFHLGKQIPLKRWKRYPSPLETDLIRLRLSVDSRVVKTRALIGPMSKTR